jgi:uncharacterized protein YceK
MVVNNVEQIRSTSRMSRPFILMTCGAIAGFALSGCATIIHGTHQDVGISSTPTGAEVWVDNIKMGETPVIAKLRRKDTHVVKLVLNGYQPYETTVTRSVSGWVFGNIIFGGLIGLGVDAISGSIYKLSPEKVTGTLADARTVALSKGDALYIDVEMKPQRGWELIGQLQRSR